MYLNDLSGQSEPDFVEGSSIPNMENNIFMTQESRRENLTETIGSSQAEPNEIPAPV